MFYIIVSNYRNLFILFRSIISVKRFWIFTHKRMYVMNILWCTRAICYFSSHLCIRSISYNIITIIICYFFQLIYTVIIIIMIYSYYYRFKREVIHASVFFYIFHLFLFDVYTSHEFAHFSSDLSAIHWLLECACSHFIQFGQQITVLWDMFVLQAIEAQDNSFFFFWSIFFHNIIR